jgi:hypothetical protein
MHNTSTLPTSLDDLRLKRYEWRFGVCHSSIAVTGCGKMKNFCMGTVFREVANKRPMHSQSKGSVYDLTVQRTALFADYARRIQLTKEN